MKTINIQQIEKAKIYNSKTVLSKEDIENLEVEITEKELCDAVTAFYADNYNKLVNNIFNNECYEPSDGDKEKMCIPILQSILKEDEYCFSDSEKFLIKSVIALFKERSSNKYY